MSTIAAPHQTHHAAAAEAAPTRGPVTRAVDVTCHLCGATGEEPLLDLGAAPLTTTTDPADDAEVPRRPLQLVRCSGCATLQIADALDAEDRHRIATAVGARSFAGRPDLARRFCEDAIDRWGLRGEGHVIEVGSGTGSLLRFFRAWQLPVLGLELDTQLSRYARLRRVPTWRAGYDQAIAGRIARAGMHADLLIVSVPIGAFENLRTLCTDATTILRPGGVMTFEIPDVLRIVGRTRVDELAHAAPVVPTIGQLQRTLATLGLDLVDVERAEVAASRLRVWIRRPGPTRTDREPARGSAVHTRVRTRLRAERAAAIAAPAAGTAFARRAELVRGQIRDLLDDARAQHCTVAGGGAGPAAVALANMAGVCRQDLAYTVDPDPVRCGAPLPGTDIPVITPEQAGGWRPDLVLALDAFDAPAAWDGVPVYSVADLIDVVHKLTGGAATT